MIIIIIITIIIIIIIICSPNQNILHSVIGNLPKVIIIIIVCTWVLPTKERRSVVRLALLIRCNVQHDENFYNHF